MISPAPATGVEAIFSAHAGKAVRAGDFCIVDVDLVMATDGNGPLAIRILKDELGASAVFDPARVVLVIDHCGPSPTEGASNLQKGMFAFAKQSGARIFGPGEGISHVLLPEQRLAGPGMLVLGSDSHSVTYGAVNCVGLGMGSTDIAVAMKTGRAWARVPETIRIDLTGQLRPDVSAKDLALHLVKLIGVDGATYCCVEIAGGGLAGLTTDARLTLCNMAIESGAKCTLMPCDAICRDFVGETAALNAVPLPDNARFRARYEVRLDDVEPLIAPPHDLTRIGHVDGFRGTAIDMAFIGTCTNGRLDDLRAAAEILRGHKIAQGLRLIIAPGSRQIYLLALREGLIDIFMEAGAIVAPPGCGPCVGTHMGVPADGDVVISTANRNFKGRMGNPRASVFLASPSVVAASAIAGTIAASEEVGA
jgi:3-isopropylmalate/(R)-2-methylmalate dehydratase large subunit